MVDAVSIALTGLRAQSQRLAATANNIANVTTVGRLPTAADPTSTVYRPLNVSFTALVTGGGLGGGVTTTVSEDSQGYTATFNPSNPYANSDGLVAAPNVDLAREMVNLLETKSVFKANASVIRTQNEMLDDFLDTLV